MVGFDPLAGDSSCQRWEHAMSVAEHLRVKHRATSASHVPADGRGDGPAILAPRDGGIATRAGERLAGHPVVAFVVVTLVGFVLLAAAAVLTGWLLKTYVLPEQGIGHADEQVNVWLAHHRTSLRTDISFWLSGIGDVLAIPALVALATIVALVRRKWRVAAFVVTAIVVEAATYRVVTLLIHRQRPNVLRLDDLPANASYYSGHTAASVVVYCGLALLITSRIRNAFARALCWAVAIAIPLLVAFSRLYRGMHHPTDVAAGALVGVGCLVIAVTAARAARSADLAGDRS
jgi:membrane-associated phospholipid phosphatase